MEGTERDSRTAPRGDSATYERNRVTGMRKGRAPQQTPRPNQPRTKESTLIVAKVEPRRNGDLATQGMRGGSGPAAKLNQDPPQPEVEGGRMTSYPNSSPCTLSDSHSRQLKGSDIALHVATARGYRTIRHRSEVPDEFADWQRRPGLLVPTHSPDGHTKGHQLKPNEPIRRKDGSAPKYETPTGSTVTLDVNPLMLEAVQQGEGDLWITEGCKKVDSLASRG